jgi:hypothetical protein
MIWIAMVLIAVGAGWLFGRGDAAANAQVAIHSAPVDLLGVLQGAALGLLNRDRVRLRRTHASPTISHLGKIWFFASLCGAATFALSPVAWGPEWLHAAAAMTGLGTVAWLGNLPSKL